MSAERTISEYAADHGWTKGIAYEQDYMDATIFERGNETVVVAFTARGSVARAKSYADGTSVGSRDSGKLETVLAWLEAPAGDAFNTGDKVVVTVSGQQFPATVTGTTVRTVYVHADDENHITREYHPDHVEHMADAHAKLDAENTANEGAFAHRQTSWSQFVATQRDYRARAVAVGHTTMVETIDGWARALDAESPELPSIYEYVTGRAAVVKIGADDYAARVEHVAGDHVGTNADYAYRVRARQAHRVALSVTGHNKPVPGYVTDPNVIPNDFPSDTDNHTDATHCANEADGVETMFPGDGHGIPTPEERDRADAFIGQPIARIRPDTQNLHDTEWPTNRAHMRSHIRRALARAGYRATK